MTFKVQTLIIRGATIGNICDKFAWHPFTDFPRILLITVAEWVTLTFEPTSLSVWSVSSVLTSD